MTSEHVMEVSDNEFQEKVLSASQLVIVDFWAEWCGPCKRIAPVLEEVAEEYAGKVKIAKVNVDMNQTIAANYGIRSIPTLLFFHNGAHADTVVGVVKKQEITNRIEKVLA